MMLLTELAAGFVMLLDREALLVAECECISFLGQLLPLLDTFNQLAPGAKSEDREDLAWPTVKGMYLHAPVINIAWLSWHMLQLTVPHQSDMSLKKNLTSTTKNQGTAGW